jgi:hypothetical protein
MTVLGCDIARYGEDSSVISICQDSEILPLKIFNKFSTMAIAGFIINTIEEFTPKEVYIDEIGLGGGVVDRLLEQKYNITGINVARKSWFPNEFNNLRSQLWYNLRQCLNPNADNPIVLPNDPDLIEELSNINYSFDSQGRIKIESKDDMKKRLGRSPDRADAVCLSLIGYEHTNQKIGGSSGLGIGWDNY